MTAPAPARVVTVDAHPVMRRGLEAALEDCEGFVVVGEHPSAEAALDAFDELRPDVAVMDYRLPGLSGTHACAALVQRGCRVVVLTSFPTDAMVLRALGAGVCAFVTKESETGVLADAVRCATAGGTYIDPRIAGRVVRVALSGRGGGADPTRDRELSA